MNTQYLIHNIWIYFPLFYQSTGRLAASQKRCAANALLSMWMSHVTYEWFMSHEWMSEWVTSSQKTCAANALLFFPPPVPWRLGAPHTRCSAESARRIYSAESVFFLFQGRDDWAQHVEDVLRVHQVRVWSWCFIICHAFTQLTYMRWRVERVLWLI